MIKFILEWSFLWALWMLLVSEWSAPEAFIAIGVSFFCAIASVMTRRAADERFGFGFKSFAQARRLPLYVVQGSWELIQALIKQSFNPKGAESLLRSVDFDMGANDALNRTRRALAIGYTCSTPNFVVLGLDGKSELLVFHQVKSSEVIRMTKNLGARP